MNLIYLDWKKYNAIDHYLKLIDQAKQHSIPVAPIDYEQKPQKMTVGELISIVEKNGFLDLAQYLKNVVNDRNDEIDLYEKCQKMISDYNYSNYDKINKNIKKVFNNEDD